MSERRLLLLMATDRGPFAAGGSGSPGATAAAAQLAAEKGRVTTQVVVE